MNTFCETIFLENVFPANRRYTEKCKRILSKGKEKAINTLKKEVLDTCAVYINALSGTEIGRIIEHLSGKIFNTGTPSVYDNRAPCFTLAGHAKITP